MVSIMQITKSWLACDFYDDTNEFLFIKMPQKILYLSDQFSYSYLIYFKSYSMTDSITYSKLVSIIFKELNRFRNNPKMLVPTLQARSIKYIDNNYMPNGDKYLIIQTQQGADPVNDLIEELRTMPKFTNYSWSYQLHCAANHRAEKIAEAYTRTDLHKNSNDQVNQDLEDLVSRYSDWNGSLSEHVLYGFCDPKDILCQLLIDDGNIDRQNRRQFFSPDLHDVGIGIQKHQKYQFVVVIILATKADRKLRNNHRISVPEQFQQPVNQQRNSNLCHGCNIF